jgi:hypothetical protein
VDVSPSTFLLLPKFQVIRWRWEKETVRKAALVFADSLGEARLSGVKEVMAVIVKSCLEGLCEIGEGNLDVPVPVSSTIPTLAYLDDSQPKIQ